MNGWGGRSGGGKMETTVLEHRQKNASIKKKKEIHIFDPEQNAENYLRKMFSAMCDKAESKRQAQGRNLRRRTGPRHRAARTQAPCSLPRVNDWVCLSRRIECIK